MAIKSLNIAINDYCNSKCTMCNIWKNERRNHVSARDYEKFFSMNDLASIVDISISGGEPFMRDDLFEITDSIINHLLNLEMLFFNTNGTRPKKVKEFIDFFAPQIKKLYGVISIEGDKDIHNEVRGVKGYKLAVSTLSTIANSGYENVEAIISTTITKKNQEIKNLEHIKELAERFSCGYTFRIADTSEVYYLNAENNNFKPMDNIRYSLIKFIEQYKSDDSFMEILREWLLTGEVGIMGNKKKGIACDAGNTFAFISAKGMIHPCIYSPRTIGSLKKAFSPKKINDLGKYEPCPCCTECTIYPMLNYIKG